MHAFLVTYDAVKARLFMAILTVNLKGFVLPAPFHGGGKELNRLVQFVLPCPEEIGQSVGISRKKEFLKAFL